jgi:uncharacterized protein (DUF488 family)
MNPIYTIGHSTLAIEQFLHVLRRHGIEAVADVRSYPVSSRFPHYNRRELKAALTTYGIRYVFLGTELGARRKEREAYEGRVASYERIAKLPLFKQGVERLKEGSSKMRLALMCAEKDPLDCHRMVLVCRNLPAELRAGVLHILEEGRTESQSTAEDRLMERAGVATAQEDMFGQQDTESPLDRAYRKRGQQIAWQEEEPLNENPHDRIHKEVR